MLCWVRENVVKICMPLFDLFLSLLSVTCERKFLMVARWNAKRKKEKERERKDLFILIDKRTLGDTD